MADPVIVGEDPIVRKVAKLAERLAQTSHPIFVEGEQGVGREHLARFLHARGPRAAAAFSIVDFGDAARGACLTQLVEGRRRCDGGTLLIKNCERIPESDLGPAVTLIMESTESTRVVLAAGRRAAAEVGSGVPELAQRLGALTLFLPSLRTRRADIPQLVSHLLARTADDKAPEVSDGAMLLLWRHDWPGNVRQLRDELVEARERAGGSTIETRDLAPRLQPHARLRAFGPTFETKSRILSRSLHGMAALV